MSLSLDKLKALRRQAGAVALATAPVAKPPAVATAPAATGPGLPAAGARAIDAKALARRGAGPTISAASVAAPASPPLRPAGRFVQPGNTAAVGSTTMPAAAASPRPTPAQHGAGDTPAAAALHARPNPAPAPSSALDWIAHSIRHADPARLAARAHGRPMPARNSAAAPAAAIPDRDRSPVTAACSPAPAQAASVMPATAAAPGNGSVLDWIDQGIGHAEPARRESAAPALATLHASARPDPALHRAAADATGQALPHAGTAIETALSASTTHRAHVITPRSVTELQRLLRPRQRLANAAPLSGSSACQRVLPGVEVSPGLHLIEDFLPQPMPAQALPLAFAKRPDAVVQPGQLLFFDTETTGLAGGTGTRAFMIGAADWQHDATRGAGLRVRQLLISTLGAEGAMLDLFATWLQPDTVLSSFNGRSYDAPLLKTRYRLARRPEPLSALEHIDLLHPARRNWKGQWENCRLGTIERNVLGIERDDDLPGSEAPGAWLGYLRGGSSTLLHRVAAHNHQDVVTLALLFACLVEEDRNSAAALSVKAASGADN